MNSVSRRIREDKTRLGLVALVSVWAWFCAVCGPTFADLADVVAETQPKVVKIYGAGGIRGLEAYQSGFLVSPDGHVLTVWSYVLDTEDLAVVLDDGSRYPAEVLYSQPQLDLAILKIAASQLPHFDFEASVELSAGRRILALSNLYGIASGNEPASVLHGHVSVVCPLAARRGAFQIPYTGMVYLLDAVTNNAGAAGGALTDHAGNLAGMLGKELKARDHDVWLNYALPVVAFREAVEAVMRGEVVSADQLTAQPPSATPWTLRTLGLQLVPNLIKNTPPFVELIKPDSPAHAAGLQRDDLVVYVDNHMVQSYSQLESSIRRIDRTQSLMLSVVRGDQLVTLTVTGLED